MDREKDLQKIKATVLKCQKCSLSKTRTYPVIGEGNHQARIVFIGEAPGATEDKTARPFCGQAGAILDELLAAASLKREEVYICNILKCRPPQNRNPQSTEIEACTPYLEKQLKAIGPQIICPLGNYATSFIFKKYGLEDQIAGISKIHGRQFKVKTPAGQLTIMPMYHPAVAVYNAHTKTDLKKDFYLLKQDGRKE